MVDVIKEHVTRTNTWLQKHVLAEVSDDPGSADWKVRAPDRGAATQLFR